MSLSIGIVGLPNVGKSTLFNSLLKRQQALTANYPFATIEPNVGIVDVPDTRIEQLYNTVLEELLGSDPFRQLPPAGGEGRAPKTETKKTSAVCKFIDIAGLAAGAHKGEGLGNKFLSHIREVNVILHLVRAFEDKNIIRAGAVNPAQDIALINTELILKDLETVEKVLETTRSRAKASAEEAKKIAALEELKNILNSGKLLYGHSLSTLALKSAKALSLLTAKPQVVVFNTDETGTTGTDEIGILPNREYPDLDISAKLENELSSLSENDQKDYLKQLGIEKSGLDKVISRCYELLGYKNFFTAGPKEVRAWQFTKGMTAQECAGVIHTDFEKNFIAADVVGWQDFVENKGWKNCKEKGLVRLEGRDYLMRDGEVVLFRVNIR